VAKRRNEEEAEEERATPKRGPQPPRMSITVPRAVMRKVRLASALADLEPNDWCRTVVLEAADRIVKKKLPNL
jgi:hypothetical protein